MSYYVNAFFVREDTADSLPSLTPVEAYEEFLAALPETGRRWLNYCNSGRVHRYPFNNPRLTREALGLPQAACRYKDARPCRDLVALTTGITPLTTSARLHHRPPALVWDPRPAPGPTDLGLGFESDELPLRIARCKPGTEVRTYDAGAAC